MLLLFILLTIVLNSLAKYQYCEYRKWHPFTNNKHIAALVLARGGSRGIPLKNLAHIGDQSLLAKSLQVINQIDRFDSVWVSTDHQRIADEGEKSGAKIHWRDPSTATDNASSMIAVQEFLNYHKEVDIVALIQCTSPFIQQQFLWNALKFIHSGKKCVFSVTHSFKLRWIQIEPGAIKAINFNPKRRPRRQDWSGEFVENGMFYFASRHLVNIGVFQNHE